MKFAFKSLIAAAAFIVAGAAGATTVTVTVGTTVYKGVKLAGAETFTLSETALGFTDVVRGNFAANGAGVLAVTKDADGFHTSASLTTTLTSLNVDETTDQVLSAAAAGGLTLTVPIQKAVSSGGSLTVTDLNVDVTNKKVYATLVGANGVGTLNNVHLWNIDTVAGGTTAPQASGPATNTFTASGLHLTTEGVDQIVNALKLVNVGKAALNAIDNFGTIAVAVNAVQAPLPVCSVKFKTTYKNPALFTTNVTLSNASSNATTGWNVNWKYSAPTLLLSIKNAKITSKPGLKGFAASPVAGNATIAAGGTTSFSFRGHAENGLPAISDLTATVGGQACAVTAE